jgi:GTP cyclohydrolase I
VRRYASDCLLPFYGRCHVGYVPAGGSIVGLSKVARVAEVFARRMQSPGRLAADIAAAIDQGGGLCTG